MVVAFDPRQDFFNVVEAADQASPEIKALGPKASGPSWRSVEGIEPRAQRIVDDSLEGLPSPFHVSLEPRRDIVIQRQCGSHIMMLTV
jgi:hypothetical protein